MTPAIVSPVGEEQESQATRSVELDVFGWDVDKALALIRESNPSLLEWSETSSHCTE